MQNLQNIDLSSLNAGFLSFLYFRFRQYHDILSINITLKDKITAVDELLPSELKEGFGRVWNA